MTIDSPVWVDSGMKSFSMKVLRYIHLLYIYYIFDYFLLLFNYYIFGLFYYFHNRRWIGLLQCTVEHEHLNI